MLEKNFLEQQKKSLLAEKERLETKIKELNKFPEYGESEDDNAMEMADFESNLSIEEQLKFLLKKINDALKAIDDSTYGTCKSCGEAIEEGRLEAMPYAELCVKCYKDSKK
ncbi:MAG: TraR/DksA C4-type zinc finger protein [Patescibacteria group bacterium]|jgi:DnaK suppressor protein